MLLEANEISKEELSEALEFKNDNGGLLGNILLGLGHITHEKLEEFVRIQFDESKWNP